VSDFFEVPEFWNLVFLKTPRAITDKEADFYSFAVKWGSKYLKVVGPLVNKEFQIEETYAGFASKYLTSLIPQARKAYILISGGRGFIGSFLTTSLKLLGFKVDILSRSKTADVYWNGESFISRDLGLYDAIINLAGESIFSLFGWSAAKKKRILESRINSTRLLVSYLNKISSKPLLISVSGASIYGENESCEDSRVDTSSFLGQVSKLWEDEALEYDKTVIFRLPLVLGRSSKIVGLAKTAGLFPVFNNKLDISWIAVEDILKAMLEALEGKLPTITNLSAGYLPTRSFYRALECATVEIPKFLQWIFKNDFFKELLGRSVRVKSKYFRPNIRDLDSYAKFLLNDC